MSIAPLPQPYSHLPYDWMELTCAISEQAIKIPFFFDWLVTNSFEQMMIACKSSTYLGVQEASLSQPNMLGSVGCENWWTFGWQLHPCLSLGWNDGVLWRGRLCQWTARDTLSIFIASSPRQTGSILNRVESQQCFPRLRVTAPRNVNRLAGCVSFFLAL